MEDKSFDTGQAFISLKRIEYLLEEIIFQQILQRTATLEDANDKFKNALKNVDVLMKEFFDSLPPAKGKS